MSAADGPSWKRLGTGTVALGMIFDDICEVKSHPDAEVRRLVYGG